VWRTHTHNAQAAAIERALAEKGWKLTHILNTHHHNDHTGGNKARLQQRAPLISLVLITLLAHTRLRSSKRATARP
jgi:glyoxylase-like metal-dependent hydrolase (beta-lactamase superfamily II)